jgi:hypothetical protein
VLHYDGWLAAESFHPAGVCSGALTPSHHNPVCRAGAT